MPLLLIDAAMVNPPGKAERMSNPVGQEILNEEWVQIRNPEIKPVSLNGMQVLHWTYPPAAPKAVDKLVITLSGTLPPLGVLRIHSGKGTPWMDEEAKIIHAYVNPKQHFFLYQISKPDCIILVTKNNRIDYARYDPPVEIGRRLRRSNIFADHSLVHS